MAHTPLGHSSNAGSTMSKVHNAALLVGKIKTIVDAGRFALHYLRAGAGVVARAAPLLLA